MNLKIGFVHWLIPFCDYFTFCMICYFLWFFIWTFEISKNWIFREIEVFENPTFSRTQIFEGPTFSRIQLFEGLTCSRTQLFESPTFRDFFEKKYGDHFPWTWWECIEPFVLQRSKIKEFWLIETVGIVTVSSSKNVEYPRSDWLPILSSDWSICPKSSSENFSWSFIFTIVPASKSSCLRTVFK